MSSAPLSASSSPTVIVIGGSFAGLSAALVLVRQLVSVLVIDSGEPRNRFSKEAHNVLAWDGDNPLELLKQSRAKLAKYPHVAFLNAKVTSVVDKSGEGGGQQAFEVMSDSGLVFQCKRIVLACGVNETLVEGIAGIYDAYGEGIVACPHCHGFEVRGQSVGVLSNSFPMAVMAHMIGMLINLSPNVTFFTNGVALTVAEQEVLAKFGSALKLDNRKIIAVSSDKITRALQGIHFEDGSSNKDIHCIFSPPKTAPNLECLGELLKTKVDLSDGMSGKIVKVTDKMESSINGIYACGDIACIAPQVLLAAADGLKAGIFVHMSLMTNNQHKATPITAPADAADTVTKATATSSTAH